MASKREMTNTAKPVKAIALECEYCGKAFKARGLKLHQNKCSKKPEKRSERREFSFELSDTNAFAVLLSFLSNQSIVKLQSVTGARYPGSDSLVSSICCQCENDELVVANGLCLACNRAKDPEFRETITTTEARKLYGIHDIDDVPHETFSVYRRGYYCLFKYDDLNQYAQVLFGSKRAWLEMLAVKVSRRRKIMATKRKKDEERRAFLSQFPEEFVEYLSNVQTSLDSEQVVKEQADRFDLMVSALAERSLAFDLICNDTKNYILYGHGEADLIAESRVQAIKAREELQRQQEEARAVLRTLPLEFVSYVGYECDTYSATVIQEQGERYQQIVAALAARDLELRSDSVLCRQYIIKGDGQIDEIVDTMEEMKFLFAHTTYASECRDIIPRRERREWRDWGDWGDWGGRGGWREWSDSDESFDDDDWIPASTLRDRREKIKIRIRDQFLSNPRGMTLPRKWLKHQEAKRAKKSLQRQLQVHES